MIAKWFASKLFGPIASAAVVVLLGAFIVQTVRIDGFPLFGPGYRGQLAECRNERGRENDAILEAQNKGREEGRVAAAADSAALAEREKKRDEDFGKRIEALDSITADLAKPRPEPTVRVTVDDPLPVVVTPPSSPQCLLDQDVLDRLRTFINQGRAP